MANKTKGEVTLTDTDGTSYTMRLDFNALAEFEDETGLNAIEALQNAGGLKVGQLRALIWCGLRQCHPDIDIKSAGRMSSLDVLNAALMASAPDGGGKSGNVKAG